MAQTVLRLLSAGWMAVALSSAAKQPLTEEPERLGALRAIFPRMQVSIVPGEKIEGPLPKDPVPAWRTLPDALASYDVYLVTGTTMNEAERRASENLLTGQFSNDRRVRLKLFQWPKERDDGLLAVLQYDFAGARPAMSCPSIGLLVHLVKDAGHWRMHDSYLLETNHHSSLQRIDLMDLTGDGAPELIIESNSGGAGTMSSGLQVFELSRGRFEELLNTSSMLEYMTDELYRQVLDIDRTLKSHGQQFCTLKTTLFENGKGFETPRITHPCYKRGYGVSPGDVAMRNRQLAPLELR